MESACAEIIRLAEKVMDGGEITQEEYDRWRYHYPEFDTSGQWHKITPSQELSDMLVSDLKEHTEK